MNGTEITRGDGKNAIVPGSKNPSRALGDTSS
jgi:hypothetical protein